MLKECYRYLPNTITSLRILFTLPFLFTLKNVIQTGDNIFLLSMLFILIIISDYLDGYVARKFKSTSIIGGKLDIIADSFYTLSSIFLLASLKVVPLWFPMLLVIKLLEFTLTSKITNSSSGSFIPLFDSFGKIGACITMTIPGVVCLKPLPFNFENIIVFLTYLVTIFFLISLINRSAFIKQQILSYSRRTS